MGKSTLFNALAGENISIVKDTPGVTRDRIYADVTWLDHSFTLIDTGGIEPDSSDIILSQMREQAQIAIDTADVIIFLTDVRQGLVDADGYQAILDGTLGVHPTFFYESLWNFVGIFLIYWIGKHWKKFDGQVFWSYVLWYEMCIRDREKG